MNVADLNKLYFGIYNWGKRLAVRRYVTNLARSNVKKPNCLTKEERQQAIDFWAPYGKINSIFFEFYKQKTGEFHPEYLPKDIYLNCVDEYFNDRNAQNVLDNKCLYTRLFPGVRQAETPIFRMNGFWYDEQMTLLTQEQAIERIKHEPALFVKAAAQSCGGKGVQYLNGNDGEMTELFLDALTHVSGDIVIQRPIRQHETFATLHPSSVNTLRILSLLTQDGVKIYSSIVRMGVGNAKVDNATAGGIFCGVREDGSLTPVAYRLNGERFDVHPTTGVVFDGYRIAGFDKALALVKKAAPLLPKFRMVSWDIVIDEQGEPLMLETNLAKGSVHFHQLTNGPLFGEDTKKIMNEVFGK